MSVVQNLTQTTTPSTHLVRDVSTILSEHNPDLYPLDTLLRQVGMRERAEATKIEWESIAIMDRKVKVNAVVAGGASPQTITLVSSSTCRADDLLFNPADLTKPLLRILSITNATDIVVQGIQGSAVVAVPAIADQTTLTFASNTKAEGGNASASRISVPSLEYNFQQIFDWLVKVSLTRKSTKNYTKNDWEQARREQLGEFRRSLNNAAFFGQRNELTDTVTGEKIWTMGGVASYITQSIPYTIASGITEGWILDTLGTVFHGNNGSPTRIFFMDSLLTTAVQKAMLGNKRTLEKVVIAGIRCTKAEFNEGTLLFKHCRDFNELGVDNFGMILDLKNVKKKELRPMELRKLDLKSQGTDAEAEQYIEQSSIEVRNPKTHALVIGA